MPTHEQSLSIQRGTAYPRERWQTSVAMHKGQLCARQWERWMSQQTFFAFILHETVMKRESYITLHSIDGNTNAQKKALPTRQPALNRLTNTPMESNDRQIGSMNAEIPFKWCLKRSGRERQHRTPSQRNWNILTSQRTSLHFIMLRGVLYHLDLLKVGWRIDDSFSY